MRPPLIAVVLLATPAFGLVLDLIPAQVSAVLCPPTHADVFRWAVMQKCLELTCFRHLKMNASCCTRQLGHFDR